MTLLANTVHQFGHESDAVLTWTALVSDGMITVLQHSRAAPPVI